MSWRKGSNASVETSGGSNNSRNGVVCTKAEYPFALALRIKVVQIVCGIAAVVMGSVAAIEERKNFNLSLGVPAGMITVLAASWSVHRSLHKSSGSRKASTWLSRILWAVACSLHVALLTLSILTLIRREKYGSSNVSNTSLSLAAIMGILAICTLGATTLALRLRLLHGPPPSGPPPRHDRCPRSTSHTGVSMVPLASTYQSVFNDNVSKDNVSDNEFMEINITDNRASFGDKSSPKDGETNETRILNPSSPCKVVDCGQGLQERRDTDKNDNQDSKDSREDLQCDERKQIII